MAVSNDRVEAAMSIILNAGDARLACKGALEAVAESDYELAEEKIKEADTKITAAHKVQTDAISDEAAGGESSYSLLFTHAQDTLMTINSEIVLAKQIIKIGRAFDARISALEKGE